MNSTSSETVHCSWCIDKSLLFELWC